MSSSPACPCGTGRAFTDCCGPLLAGTRQAETAEQLMRSRYTAYLEGAIDYLIATTAAAARRGLDRRRLAAYCRTLRGVSLKILATGDGGPFDAAGTVTFEATLEVGGRALVQREHSRFVHERGRWVYVDGDVA